MRYLTQEGYEKLLAELKERKTVLRKKIALAIKEAKEQGDLSENAEYSEAKRQQRENESRIMELENLIRNSKIAQFDKNLNQVQIGSKVEVEVGGKKMSFDIVGSNEANPAEGKISNESPLGKSFLGKKKGEEVEVVLPTGKKALYKIISIQ